MRLYHNNLTPILTFLVTLVLVKPSYSQESHFAPLNPEYVKYEEQKAIVKEKSAGEQEQFYGYIPSPMKFNFGNYEKLRSNLLKGISISDFPSKYDLRTYGYVTSVKNQGSTNYSGNCWAFATMGSLESNWLMNHYGNFDLSEQNMISCHGYEWGYGEGGNELIATAYLSRLSGPGPESEDQYLTNIHTCHGQITLQRNIIEAKFIPYDIELIKSVVMNYGGVYVTMRASGEALYYNSDDYTWYYNGEQLSNDHAVLIVGWDDDILVTGGVRSPRGTHGAWLIKNSWGKSWGNNGYFYLSYYDAAAYSEVMYLPASKDTSLYTKINMYDQLGATTSFRPGKQDFGYGLTRFNAPQKETIVKVGTFLNSVGTIIDIDIYKDFNNGSLQNLIASRHNIICDFPGYKTFDIFAEVQGNYYVKVKYYTPSYGYSIPVEYPIEGFAAPEICNTGTNWISADGITWENIGTGITDYEMDLTIRTYTAPSNKPLALFVLPNSEECFSDSVLLTPEGVDTNNTYIWKLLPDGLPAEDTTYEPFYGKFASTGQKEIKLYVNGSIVSDSLVQTLSITNNLSVNIVTPYPVVSYGKQTKLIAVCNCDSFIWDAPYNTLNSGIIEVTPEDTGINIYGLTAYNNSNVCFGTDSITIIANQNPPNDDVCNAIELQIGTNGPFDNIDATVEEGEPAPIEGECNEPMQWCKEGGLQNSVWFKFTVPESDSISIITSGFDSQIAIYQADSCAYILNNNSTLIAANDDYFGEDKDFAAAFIELTNLVPGQEYYLQLDGSAGGVQGTFYIDYLDLGDIPIDSSTFSGKYILYYNQLSDQLCINFINNYTPTSLVVKIYDVSGIEKYVSGIMNNVSGNRFCIDCSPYKLGNNVYVVKIETESIKESKKIFIPRIQ